VTSRLGSFLPDEEADAGPEERPDAAETRGPSRNSIVSRGSLKPLSELRVGVDARFARVSSNYNFLNNGDDGTMIMEKKPRVRETGVTASAL